MDFESKESKEMKSLSTSEKKSPARMIFQAMTSIELRIFLVWSNKVTVLRIGHFSTNPQF